MSYYTPKEVLDRLSGLFSRELISARGYLIRKNSYFKLSMDGHEVDVSGEMLVEVPLESFVEVDGYLTYSIYQGGGIYPRILVKDVRVIEDSGKKLTDAMEELLRRRKTHRGWQYLVGLLEKEKVLRLAVVHGRGAQVHRDFENAYIGAVGAYAGRVAFDFFESPLSDEELSQTLSDLTDYHAVFVLRGGGAREELQRVGGILSASVVIERDIPLYLALGHSLDRGLSMLERVAEHTFPTPSIAGAELGKAVRLITEYQLMAGRMEELSMRARLAEDLRREKESLLEELRTLRQKVVEKPLQVNYILLAFAAGVAVGFALRAFLQ